MELLRFNTYDEYIEHFITKNDLRYLRNMKIQRKLIHNTFGKGCLGNLLTRREFVLLREKTLSSMQPPELTGLHLFSEHLETKDRVLKQLAQRETKLMQKQISTVIFLIMRSTRGLEISSFIDLEESFKRSSLHSSHPHYVDWRGIFKGTVKLHPRKDDLSFFDWHKNKVVFNNSDNFRIVTEGAHSLLLMHTGDHNKICVNAGCECNYSKNAKRSIHFSNIYGYVIFFDHINRRIN